MTRTVLIRFAPPAPIKTKTSTRTWDGEKLAAFLQEGIEPLIAGLLPEAEVRVQLARQADIRFEGWKPEKVTELRESIGEMIGTVMEGVEPEDYLSA